MRANFFMTMIIFIIVGSTNIVAFELKIRDKVYDVNLAPFRNSGESIDLNYTVSFRPNISLKNGKKVPHEVWEQFEVKAFHSLSQAVVIGTIKNDFEIKFSKKGVWQVKAKYIHDGSYSTRNCTVYCTGEGEHLNKYKYPKAIGEKSDRTYLGLYLALCLILVISGWVVYKIKKNKDNK